MSAIIKLKFEDQKLTINQTGAGIMEYYLDGIDGRHDIIYGYSKIEDKVGSMGEVLFPFPGRVENSKYQFNGKKYQLSDVKIKDGHAIHGFVKDKDWKIVEKTDFSVTLEYQLDESEYASKGFPFSLKISLKYQLSEDGLECQSRIENIGQKSAPFGLGFHPYFAVGTETIDDMIVNINAKKLVEFDSELKPTGKLIDINSNDLDFNQSKNIHDRIIDNCYTDLLFSSHPEGVKAHLQGVPRKDHLEGEPGLLRGEWIAETLLSDGKGREIIIWQDKNFPYLQVYSADTIGDKHRRRGFAVEPQTCTGFAFNVPEMGLKVLQPGEKFEGSWGVGF